MFIVKSEIIESDNFSYSWTYIGGYGIVIQVTHADESW